VEDASFIEKLKTFLCCCFKKTDPHSKLIERGVEMVEKELNVFTVIQLLRKLKVSMTVMIGNDKEKL
jgi:hypothetical protein